MLIGTEQWDKAIQVCENHYRIQLKTTCFLYARQLEEEEAYDEAIQMYEKSGTHKTEVMRMLQNSAGRLEVYVMQKKEK